MNPDPAFLAFFAGPWQRALAQVEIPGMDGASWDRKAAYLLFRATDGGRFVLSPSEPTPPTDKTDKTDKTDTGSIFD